MGTVLNFLSVGRARQREEWLSQKKPDETRDAYINAASKFTTELKVVTGEANGKLFEKKEFTDAIDRVLRKNINATFKLVFHKRDTEAEALEDFRKENPLFTNLKERYPKQVHIYWTPKRPRQHYAVVDNRLVILEQPHHATLEPFWATIIHDSEISTRWENRFDTYVSYLREMSF